MTDENRCPVTAPEGDARCTLPTGHRLPHRGEGCMWLDEGSRCPAQRTPEGDQCVRPVRHPLPHRDAWWRKWALPFDGEDEPRRCAMFPHAADQGQCIFDAGHEHPHRDERDTEWQVTGDGTTCRRDGCTYRSGHEGLHGSGPGDYIGGRLVEEVLPEAFQRISVLERRPQNTSPHAALAEALERAQRPLSCGATHTPEDVTYVCSRRSGHTGGHLDDAQDEWWMPVGGAQPGAEKPVAGLDVCGSRAGGDLATLCTERNGHDMPHKDKLTGLTWGPEPTAECGLRTRPSWSATRLRCSRVADHDGHHTDRRFGTSWTEDVDLPSLCTWPCVFREGHKGECSQPV